MPKLAPVQPRKWFDPCRPVLHRRKMHRLLGIPVIDSIPIHMLLMIRIVLSNQRLGGPSKLRRLMGTGRSYLSLKTRKVDPIVPQPHEKSKQIGLLPQRQRLEQTRRHQRATRSNLLDRLAFHRTLLTRRRIHKNQRRGLKRHDIPCPYLRIVRLNLISLVSRLLATIGPKQTLGQFHPRTLLANLSQLRTDDPPCTADPMA